MTISNLQQRTLWAISLALALIIVLIASYSAWQWHHDWQLRTQPLASVSSLKNSQDATFLITAIPEQHLFGQSLAQGSVPVSNLQMVITGIVKSMDDGKGKASKVYISLAGKPSKIYQLGDTLPYGVRIYQITADTIIFDNDGRLEKLSLTRDKLVFKPKGFLNNET